MHLKKCILAIDAPFLLCDNGKSVNKIDLFFLHLQVPQIYKSIRNTCRPYLQARLTSRPGDN